MTPSAPEMQPAAPAPRRAGLLRWWGAVLPSLVLRAPRAAGLEATPGVLLGLVAALLGLGIAVERLYWTDGARFEPRSLLSGWAWTVAAAWCCYALAARGRPHEARETGGADEARPANAAMLFALLTAQAFVMQAVLACVYVPLLRSGRWPGDSAPLAWIAWGLTILWLTVAQGRLLWRSGSTMSPGARAAAVAVLGGVLALESAAGGVQHWRPEPRQREADAADAPVFRVTQALVEQQAPLIERQAAALAPQREGVRDVYVLTFAPYAAEDVFLRETRLVADVLSERYGSTGRVLALANHASTASELPWATPLNLQRAIAAVAARMDRDEDLLFVHLSSHGARDGQLSATFWPLEVDPVTPALLREALDAAGVRWRIVSVSACYSGSWIEPLATDESVVLTAADAEHTSYGCGRRSPMTYFGRAMYDEALRSGLSLEAAHAQARRVLVDREREAGKSDGYSNPQIRVGEAIRPLLERLDAAAGRSTR